MKVNKSMESYITDNDLEGAYERYKSTSKRWEKSWWATIETIYNNCKEWAKQYILNPIEKTLKKIKNSRISIDSNIQYLCNAEGCGAYIVQHYTSSGISQWIKCGKANNVKSRLKEHFSEKPYKDTVRGVCLAFYPCLNSEHAEASESVIRRYFIEKGYALQRQDRFPTLTDISEEDYIEIGKRIDNLKMSFAY